MAAPADLKGVLVWEIPHLYYTKKKRCLQVKDNQVTISLPEDCIATLIDVLTDKVQSDATYIEWLTRENQRIKEAASIHVHDDSTIKGDSEA